MSRILEKDGVNNTNIDGARFNNFCAGERSGIIKSTLNECAITTPSSSVINIETGELLVSGVRVVLNSPTNFTFSTFPSSATRYSLIAEIVIDSNSDITSRIFVQLANSALVQNDLFKTENGAGTYQIELAKFTLTNDGIEDLVRTVDVIAGSKSGGNGLVNIGTVETEMLAEGLDAEVDVETVFNQEDNKYYTNFQFHIPKGDTGEQGIQGIQGETGNGITTIEKTGTSGLTDTYTITFTSGATTTFNVANGKGIASITKTGTSGLVDTYTIAFNDSTSTTFTVTNGAKGDKGDTGATPDLAIGTVTTLETGQQATATISGTSEEPKLNLGLPKGSTGNTGSQGIQGKSYSPKGEWSSATAYVNNATTIDTVLYLGSTYYCKQSNTNQTPTNTTYWGVLAEKGEAGVTIVQTTGQSTTAVISQKAVSDAIDAKANNTELRKKAVQPYIQRAYSVGNGPRLVGTYNYSTSVGDTRPLFYMVAKEGHGNGTSYLFWGEYIFGVSTTGVVTAKSILKISDGTYGKLYYRHDTDNKILYIYIYTGQYSSAYFSDLIQINAGDYSSYFTLVSAGSVTSDTVVEGVNVLYPASGGTIALTSQIPTTQLPAVETTIATSGAVSQSLTPNVLYKFTSTSMTSLTITFGTATSGRVNEYMFQFIASSTPTTLTLPAGVIWANDDEPGITAGKTYQISIINNLAVYGEF